MYWEEIIELIKTHGDEPKSSFPNPYNDSDEYEVYQYERGTLKTSYVHIEEFSEKIKDKLKKYFKYGLHNIQIFCSIGASEGGGEHQDETNVLILCLEGEISYVVEGLDPVVLKAGDTCFIKKNYFHAGISSPVPRICLSCAVKEIIPSYEVTYFFG